MSNPRLAPGPAAPDRRTPTSGSSAIFAPGAAEHDLNLQQDLVLLLSKLEQHRSRLANPDPEQKDVTVLQVAVAMVRDLVQAAEEGEGGGTEAKAAAVAKATAFLGPTEALLRQLDDPSLVRAFVRLFRKPMEPAEQLRQVRQAAQGLVEVVQTFFALHKAGFQVPAATESWSQAQAVFVNDLLHDFYRLHG